MAFRRLLLCGALLALASPAAELRFGRAAVSITPTEQTGGVKPVLDPLQSKAVVLETGGATAAIVVLDLVVPNLAIVEGARARAAELTPIPAGHIMITATHTHTSLVPGWAGSSSFPALTPPTEGPAFEAAERYKAFAIESIAESIRRAYEDLQPATVSAAIGHEDSLAFNRRFLMKDGTVVFNPGIGNPNIVRPVGPIDPAVPVIYFESPDGEPLAALVNYAMHLDTVGGDVYSADYPHPLSQALAEAKGDQMLTMFSIGTAGNINHVNVHGPKKQKGPEEAARIGLVLAGEVLRTLRKLEPVADGELRVKTEVVPLPPVELGPDDLATARRLAAQEVANPGTLNLLERVFAQKVFFAERQQGRPLEVEVQVITLGSDVAWVALPGEVFVEIGMTIKTNSPFRFTVVHELAYDWIRYVPNRKGLQEGSYEATNTRCGAGCGEALAEAAIRNLLSLHEAPRQRIVR